MENFEAIPGWLEVLMGEKFFNSCLAHESHKKNEENSFCLECCISLCLHCLPSHKTHRILQVEVERCRKFNVYQAMYQIRRYVYQDVLRLKDAENLMECSFIQTYITNSAKVLFLKRSPVRRPMKSSYNYCIVCERNLQDPYLFCSIFCKVSYMENNSRKLTLYKYDNSSVEEEDGQLTSYSAVQTLAPLATSFRSNGSTKPESLTARSLTRKYCSCTSTVTSVEPSSECSYPTNRRKNVPRRSPFS